MRNDFFGEMAETGGVPLNASPVRRWAGVFGHRPFAFPAFSQAEPDMEETWDLSDPADPLNIGMGWGTGGHGLGL